MCLSLIWYCLLIEGMFIHAWQQKTYGKVSNKTIEVKLDMKQRDKKQFR